MSALCPIGSRGRQVRQVNGPVGRGAPVSEAGGNRHFGCGLYPIARIHRALLGPCWPLPVPLSQLEAGRATVALLSQRSAQNWVINAKRVLEGQQSGPICPRIQVLLVWPASVPPSLPRNYEAQNIVFTPVSETRCPTGPAL